VSRSFNLCSDPRQCLYFWRSAVPQLTEDLHNIMSNQVPLPSGKMTEPVSMIHEHFLHKNYRSVEQLVQISNRLAENFRTKTHEPSIPTRPIAKGTLTIREFPNSDLEYNHIANEIQAKVMAGKKYSDFAILARTNKCLLDIESACIGARVPYHLKHDSRSTTKQSTFLVMAAYYALVLNPKDLLAYLKILASIKGYGEKVVEKIELFAKNFLEFNPRENLFTMPIRQIPGISALQMKTAEVHRDRVLRPFVEKALRGYQIPDLSHEIRSLHATFGSFDGDESIHDLYWKFKETALQTVCRTLDQIHRSLMEDAEYKKISGVDKIAYIHSILALGSDDKEADDADDEIGDKRSEVTLATIHAMKGKEAPIVYVANLRGISNPKPDPEEENLCCLYVAVTRAQDELHISSSEQARNFKGVFSNTKPNIELMMYKDATGRYLRDAKKK